MFSSVLARQQADQPIMRLTPDEVMEKVLSSGNPVFNNIEPSLEARELMSKRKHIRGKYVKHLSLTERNAMAKLMSTVLTYNNLADLEVFDCVCNILPKCGELYGKVKAEVEGVLAERKKYFDIVDSSFRSENDSIRLYDSLDRYSDYMQDVLKEFRESTRKVFYQEGIKSVNARRMMGAVCSAYILCSEICDITNGICTEYCRLFPQIGANICQFRDRYDYRNVKLKVGSLLDICSITTGSHGAFGSNGLVQKAWNHIVTKMENPEIWKELNRKF